MASVLAHDEQPISRTYQYRKVMKPMLERKRRARINRCLDELKELLVGALQAEGESVSRLEKADVLELTVRHLHKLRRSQQLSEATANDRFRCGFSHCANEVAKYMATVPSPIDIDVSARLLSHLDNCIHRVEGHGVNPPHPSPLINYTPPSSPLSGGVSPVTKPLSLQPPHLHTPFLSQFRGPMGFQDPQPMTEEPFDLSSGSVWRPW